tara:strand:- start:451 stop:591 length:141 start_codon:yes stop_codon:yes gene_type:complete
MQMQDMTIERRIPGGSDAGPVTLPARILLPLNLLNLDLLGLRLIRP